MKRLCVSSVLLKIVLMWYLELETVSAEVLELLHRANSSACIV